jgi:hypothetical protein
MRAAARGDLEAVREVALALLVEIKRELEIMNELFVRLMQPSSSFRFEEAFPHTVY